jgi:imidazolonepropionase-like amidohydrolase
MKTTFLTALLLMLSTLAACSGTTMPAITPASPAACVCNLDHELGTLEPGKVADVLVVNGDPLQDLGALTRIRLVIHNGAIIRE